MGRTLKTYGVYETNWLEMDERLAYAPKLFFGNVLRLRDRAQGTVKEDANRCEQDTTQEEV